MINYEAVKYFNNEKFETEQYDKILEKYEVALSKKWARKVDKYPVFLGGNCSFNLTFETIRKIRQAAQIDNLRIELEKSFSIAEVKEIVAQSRQADYEQLEAVADGLVFYLQVFGYVLGVLL